MRVRHVGILAAAVAGLLTSGSGVKAAPINLASGSQLLSALIANNGAGGGAVLGNLTFNNFVYTPTNVSPTASQVNVSPFTLGVESGMAFNANVPWSNGDWGISFTVSSSSGLLTDDYLAVSGGAPTGTVWTVNETIAWSGASLNITDSSNNITPGDPVIGNFAGVPSLTILKDINVSAGADITTVYQGFSTVPVPVPAAAWMGSTTLAGLVGLGLFRRRRYA